MTDTKTTEQFKAWYEERSGICDLVSEATGMLYTARGLRILGDQQTAVVDALQDDQGRRERVQQALAAAEEARTRFIETASVLEQVLLGTGEGGTDR